MGALAWNDHCIYSGSRDRFILQNDTRSSKQERKLAGHRQEVCGLKWSPDRQLLASGGNDNRLLVWNQSCINPIQIYTDHTAAVKAIAWSPHQQGLLASGGGTADRYIRFWNTLTAQSLQCIDTGSQVKIIDRFLSYLFHSFKVCNLAWSKHSNELVSTVSNDDCLFRLMQKFVLAWLFTKSDCCLEISYDVTISSFNWTYLSCIIFSCFT